MRGFLDHRSIKCDYPPSSFLFLAIPELGERGRWWRGWGRREDCGAGRREEQKRQAWITWCVFPLICSPLTSRRPSVTHVHPRGVADVVVSRRTDRERIPVRYCTLGTRDAAKYVLLRLHCFVLDLSLSVTLWPRVLRDPHTLVELSAFSAINRFQPFNVAVSSNVLLLMVGLSTFQTRAVGFQGRVGG